MSHFAEIDKHNKVIRVTVGDNNSPDEGYQWLIDNLGGRWIQTSYNSNFKFNFAGIGDTYDETLDAFISQQCHDEAILNVETARWNCTNPAHSID